MQTATSETESKSLDLSICVHHYTLRAPCPKGQGTAPVIRVLSCVFSRRAVGAAAATAAAIAGGGGRKLADERVAPATGGAATRARVAGRVRPRRRRLGS